MTLAEFQPHVEQALIALEWQIARARWRAGLLESAEAISRALLLSPEVMDALGIEREPLETRLKQIDDELRSGDVTADQVPQSPVRSVPMDMITAAVVRRILRLPAEFPVLSIKRVPPAYDIAEAVQAIARRWQTPNGQGSDPSFADQVHPPNE